MVCSNSVPYFIFLNEIGYLDIHGKAWKHLSAGDGDENASTGIILSEATERALQLRPPSSLAVVSSGRKNTGVMSSSEYLALRSYQGLEIHNSEIGRDHPTSDSAITVSYEVVEGRTGRAAVYSDEAKNV